MQKQIWIDYLRVLAVFAVVTIHTTMFIYGDFNKIPIDEWWSANILNGLSRFSVPMFVMISGYVLLGRDIGIKEFYIKRGFRILPALIFWSIFYVAFDFFFNDKTIATSIWQLTVGFVRTGATYYHLWYLTMFICLMMFLPFVNNYILGKPPSIGDFYFLMGIFALFMFLNQCSLVAKEVFGVNIGWFKLFPWYLAYLISGYFIGNYHEKINISNKAATASLLFLIVISLLLNFYSASYGIVKDWFVLNNTGIMNFMVTLLIFYLFANNKNSFKSSNLISNIATSSFGIYLIHPVFLALFRKPVNALTENLSVSILILLSIAFTLSLIFILVLRKIKYFKLIC